MEPSPRAGFAALLLGVVAFGAMALVLVDEPASNASHRREEAARTARQVQRAASEFRDPMQDPAFAPVVAALRSERAEYSLSWGVSLFEPNRIVAEFAPGGEATARGLHERFGDKLALSVGTFRYPWDATTARDSCPAIPRPTRARGLALRPAGGNLTFDAREDGHATIELLNRRGGSVEFYTGGVQEGYLVERGTDRVVGVASNTARTMEGRLFSIPPGDAVALSVHVGTASCRTEHGYRLPSGAYDLVVVATGGLGQGNAATEIVVVSESISVRLTDGD